MLYRRSCMDTVHTLATHLSLGDLLRRIDRACGPHSIVGHWQQGEFHHDLVLEMPAPPPSIPGPVFVVATNCNDGVKEIICFGEAPVAPALWHYRCSDNPEFSGVLQPIRAIARTQHWFDPCVLLADDARSELRPEMRERQPGGGWRLKACRVTRDATASRAPTDATDALQCATRDAAARENRPPAR